MMISRKAVFVSAAGGVLDVLSADGEVVASVHVPAGRVSVVDYLDLVPVGGTWHLGKGLSVLAPRSAAGIQPYGDGAFESGANPDFQPTSATRLERELRLTLSRMQAATSRVEARERALAGIERVPRAKPKAEPDAELIEAPEVEPKASE